ncbi:hypothetical protein C9374_005980 [Naegleria lovaniensis]|uniref:Uncharacterized protein n=1 Tax=Naegleria lovaniensis TaxID=51637 RepID=A0AA88GM11_NAELO|nr:uncharacterized protein C9374_014730 [Naegleria lovaniensis]XP_044547276.1 uncharacterized protein C9374_005980 [Naegleria lovaniensis]KAG2370628.1 hypothetical protein C9374_014730 [Naegleria lovaniensis]KAG2381596.1 hypothetical protein C9374_005980 [Naegleria lovaniensis]
MSSQKHTSLNHDKKKEMIERLEKRCQELECRLFPLEMLQWEASSFLLPYSKNKTLNHTTIFQSELISEPNESHANSKTSLTKSNRNNSSILSKGSLLKRLRNLLESYNSMETPLMKEFILKMQQCNLLEYESCISDAKMEKESLPNEYSMRGTISNEYLEMDEKSLQLLKRDAQWRLIENQSEMIDRLSKSFEELDRLLPLLDALNDRNQFTDLCNKLNDLKSFQIEMDNIDSSSTQQSFSIQQKLCAYNDLVSGEQFHNFT